MFKEWPKCPLKVIRCSRNQDKIKDKNAGGFSTFKIRNIMNEVNSTKQTQKLEQFYIKFIYTSAVYEWRSCVTPPDW